jgi:hypothetical protein
MLADLLLELNEPGQALREYEASNGAARNRFLGLYGAGRAAELAGNREKARGYFAELLLISAQADAERSELQYARAYLGSER